MQQYKTLPFKTAIFLIFAVLFSNSLMAHFGSKGPYGGSVSVAITYDSTVYIGTLNGGVYSSTNSTLSAWRAMPVGLRSGKITALAHSGSYLFAGTLDAGVYIYNGYIGTDRYWVKIKNGLPNLNIRSLIALDSITLLVGTEGGGLYKTTNKGASWTAINNAVTTNKTITALTKAGNRIVLTTLDGGVFFSENNGSNWTSLNDVNTLQIGGTISLSYNQVTGELAVINNNGLFVLANASTTTTSNYTVFQTGLPIGIGLRTITNNGANWYLATDQGAFVTSGSTWEPANTGLTTNNVTVVLPFKTDLLAGTYKEGVFKSSASNISWSPKNTNFNNLETYAMECSGTVVVVVATEKGVFVSKDLASSYKRANTGLTDSLNVTFLKFFGTKLYASTRYAGIFESSDTGRTWVALNTGLSNLDVRKIFASISALYLLDASNELYQFSGPGWTSLQTGLPSNAVPTSMAFYGSKILLGTFGDGVFTREAANGTWSASNAGLSNLNITAVVTNGIKLFAGTEGNGVFVSDLTASNWSQTAPVSITHTVTMGLDGTKIQDMAYNAGYVFASYEGGLLATSNNGSSWIAGGNQFNLPSYTDVQKITFVTTRVFVTTENNSVYSNALSELPVITGIHDINQALNASVEINPNPSNGVFTIQMNDDNTKVVGLIIYDNTGRLVRNFTTSVDSQSIQIIGDFSPGIYFVQINTTEGIIVKKVVIE